ncbi:MAG: diphosphomevalonate decarboxylase [Bacteroidetes bacterium]|nr:diphosphomevalonate decarboxylase [Bacteroidota bacterium]MBL6944750.1 diphosphomevalonate decarboxylase [Bacteroidales bacterium]
MNYPNPKLIFKDIPSGKVGWRSPSNIALVKYWGKKGTQIPANASISFTLSESLTETTVEFSPAFENNFNLEFLFEGKSNEIFAAKTSGFFYRIMDIFPFINQLDFKISSKNTFPHSAGIASSASGMSAIALALCEIAKRYFNAFSSEDEFFKNASFVARLGSGSACRSIYGGLVSWGEITGYKNTSNLFANSLSDNVDPVFETFHDSILIVDSEQKKVSSSIGHGLMNSNPFSKGRFEQAGANILRLLDVLKSGELIDFVDIVESEALSLHAMMMTSTPYFFLIKTNTISIIEKIWDFRKETGVPVCFTLDAGPNVHILYPHENKDEIVEFINSELLKYTNNNTVIHDKVGNGPVKI